ncbi:MAG: sulfotransferase [Acidobacteria bacterium]|nr:sulfotransferase [Acidobacteriota bacterium]
MRTPVEQAPMGDTLPDLHVTHTRVAPVFVLAPARSGTSLLGALLRKYLQISFGTESQFIVRVARRVGRYGDLRHDAHLARLVADVGRERCFTRWEKRFGFRVDREAVMQSLGTRTLAGVIDAYFQQLARHQGMVRWGDKTPEYVWNLGVLERLFPDAQYVHIIRDGRDVALSGFEQHFGAGNAYTAARRWRAAVSRIREFGAACPADRYTELRYEDLLADPARELLQLASFVGVTDGDGVLARRIRDAVRDDVRAANSGKWKHGMAARDQRVFAGEAGEWLERCGYDVPARRVVIGPAERAYYEVDALARRVARPSYWRDTAYRASLRAAPAVRWLRRGLVGSRSQASGPVSGRGAPVTR